MTSFQPDKYRESKPIFRNASNTDQREVSALLSACYGILLDRGANVHQAGGAEINSNNFRVETTDQHLLVKRFNCSKQQSLLKRKLCLYRWLYNHSIPVPIVHENGSRQLLTSYGEAYWCVMEFIEGTYFAGTNREIEEAARVTERLFQSLDKVPAEFVPKDDPVEMLCASECQELVAQVEEHQDKWKRFLGHETASLLLKEWARVKHSVNQFVVEESSTNSDSSLSHIDLHPHNLLFNANHVAAVLDFESFRMASRLVMVSFSAYKLLRQAVVRARSHGRDIQLQALVAKYRSSLSDAKFLPTHAGALAKAEILRRLFFILKGVIVNEDPEAKRWLGDVHMHVAALQEVQRVFPESNRSASS